MTAIGRGAACLSAGWVLAACATTAPPPTKSEPPPPAQPAPPIPARPAAFADLPGWASSDPGPGVEAFLRSCDLWSGRAADAPVWSRAPYAGRVSDWAPACAAVELAADAQSARSIFEAMFTPVEVDPLGGEPKFTGYYEPVFDARREPQGRFTEPILAVPDDLEQVDAALIGGTPGARAPAQRLPNGRLQPYPARGDISASSGRAIAYGHPADVVFLQIQGSGRLRFADGAETRAAFGAHNGQPFASIFSRLLREGEITMGEATLEGLRAWMDRSPPARVREAVNANPRTVFFIERPMGDPALGPPGALTVPLTPLGSMAVDPSYHALGAPMYVQTTVPGLGGTWSGLLVAQDTGGAIKGAVRGDLYFGTGDAAGAAAATMNAPGRLWVLLPRAVAARLGASS